MRSQLHGADRAWRDGLFPASLVATVLACGAYFDESPSLAEAARGALAREPTQHAAIQPGRDAEYPYRRRLMKERSAGTDLGRTKARHGARSEVNWEGGSGRQPYSNQSSDEATPPSGGAEFPEGDRGDLSGRNLDQLEQAKRKP